MVFWLFQAELHASHSLIGSAHPLNAAYNSEISDDKCPSLNLRCPSLPCPDSCSQCKTPPASSDEKTPAGLPAMSMPMPLRGCRCCPICFSKTSAAFHCSSCSCQAHRTDAPSRHHSPHTLAVSGWLLMAGSFLPVWDHPQEVPALLRTPSPFL